MPRPKGFKKQISLNKTREGKERRDDLLEDVGTILHIYQRA